jgi:putative endonuclease
MGGADTTAVIRAQAGIHKVVRRVECAKVRRWISASAGRAEGDEKMEKQPCVYILASGKCGTLYIGVTSNLIGRLLQHREGLIKGFTSRYGVVHLVHFEMADTREAAIVREKQLKKWRRDWKLNLIERTNPDWTDLAIGLGLPPGVKVAIMDSRLRGE